MTRRPTFFALDLALEGVQLARPIVKRIARHDHELQAQLQRALTRCVLALAEGTKREGGNRQSAYRRARGEANEALVAIQLAQAWGHLSAGEAAPAADKLDHLVAILVRLTQA